MLLHWIPETINPIPSNASHIARVGAVVLNDKREMLVVQEKMGPLRGVWKISTGIIHQGEDISLGVVREVKEETGIDTKFVEVLAFSQEHKVFFGKSELLFLCMMRPLSFDIKIQETEIEAAKWMPLEEYAAQLSPQENGLRKYITDLCIAKVDRDYSGFSPILVKSDSDVAYFVSFQIGYWIRITLVQRCVLKLLMDGGRTCNAADISWDQRLRTCIGAADGLQYLHDLQEGSQQRVLHRDIKSGNILLEKIGNQRLQILTGYLTKESDVCSFGAVLFEVLCGRHCVQNYEDNHRFLPVFD
nr:NUDIX hydrolase 2-like isoform X1 [Tanacetum cinerariifolium]